VGRSPASNQVLMPHDLTIPVCLALRIKQERTWFRRCCFIHFEWFSSSSHLLFCLSFVFSFSVLCTSEFKKSKPNWQEKN
jgi:hypothetical protein